MNDKEETALQRVMRLAMVKEPEPFTPSKGVLKGLMVLRVDGRPFADESGRTTLTADEMLAVKP